MSHLANIRPNGTTAQLGNLDVAERIAFFATTRQQFFGEEVITLLPFLALLQWFSKDLGIGRKGAIGGAWLTTSVAVIFSGYPWSPPALSISPAILKA